MTVHANILLDVDTGTDDAVAIMMAAQDPRINLIACTTVWGNLPVENTTDNTLRVLDHIGAADVPVYRGRESALVPVPAAAQVRTGKSRGMHPKALSLPDPTSEAGEGDAVCRIIEKVRAASEPVSLVAVGPLTNIAAATIADPKLSGLVKEVVIMGGAHDFGNVTPAAEANIWHDPFSAEIVFNAGFERIVMVPLDATHQALIDIGQCDQLANLATPAALAASDFIQQRIETHERDQPQPVPRSAAVHDAVCIAYLLEPSVLELQHVTVSVELAGFSTFGRTVMDYRSRGARKPNVYVATEACRDTFYNLLKFSLSQSIDN